ncbi:ABC transporter ATP-binding protein [Clostridium formicaceticum]|uniref:Sn-glycerol-3-phosphate import ATP-binding protein UgpC n=1 Tax=Clostridium formicaceticum TaxID=1497 RepID=A0AAC9RLZ8_9CLOT|nr:ABC transporter ATP-binding protein [Clostridium formicaceticum]AOY77518.1 hypothetical protein BJL90_17650 [Clostridium formicaceticum]ARE88087.1 sn-glycerol-3-phosphate import ATP-binding protein UgpC [Clostridium formicaceticum]
MDIRLTNLTKHYEGVEALRGLNAEIKSGSLVSLLGPSGCGKSTILNLIAGLIEPNEGEVFFGDKNMNNVEPEHRNIGMVFQSYALYPHMSALKNIVFPLKMKKVPKKEAEERAKEIAKLVKIEELLNRKPKALSGGQQQRVAIARALIKNPQVLLLDEPFSNLDARLRIEMREEIKNIQKKTQITTLFVTHDQEEAMSISDQILLLNEGELQQYTNPKEMYDEPRNRFVANFLGNPPLNILKALWKKEEDHFVIEVQQEGYDSIKISLQENQVKACSDKITTQTEVGIRPENVIVRKEKKENSIPCSVSHIQLMGKELYIKVQIKNQKMIFIAPWNSDINVGETVYIEIQKALLF